MIHVACVNLQVWCGHEYTASNYKFALSVDPDNATLQTANAEAKAVLSKGGMTVPSTIGKELDTNPFMRADQLAVQTAVGLGPGADVGDVLQRVRDLKDRF
jgi:hydroxyacylglutathione hydrolase